MMHIQRWSSIGLVTLKYQPNSLLSLTSCLIPIYNLKELVFCTNLEAEVLPIHVSILSTRHLIEYLLCFKSVLEFKIVAAHREISRVGIVRRLC